MPRRKKVVESYTNICPVCGKQFTWTPDHAYIIKGQYTCGWDCFLARVKGKNKEENKDEN